MRMSSKFGTTTLFTAILLVVIAFIPTVSASSGEEATSASPIINPWIEEVSDNMGIAPLATVYPIVEGQVDTHTKVVSGTKTSFYVDLWWIQSYNTLSLTVVSPTGVTYGPYYADSGTGRLRMTLPTSGNLATGTWTSYVRGVAVPQGTAHYIYSVTVS